MQDFDFDYWKDLAAASPLEFEAQRRKALQRVVDDAPPAHRPALAALLGTTMIYVTHDQVEAMTMADRIVVMREGRVEQQGTPLERAIHAQTLMLESVGYLKTAWTSLVEAVEPLTRPGAYHPRPGPNTSRS